MATEKRILDTHTFSATHIIFDIEGTTTSVSFVKDTLFPYVRKHLDQYLNDNWKDEGFQSVVTALREQAKIDENDGLEGFVTIPEGDSDEVKNAVIKNVLWQMDNDRKTKSLKDLQSLVMTSGYEKGNIIGHIYDDVDTNLKAWKDLGKLLYIYSSGSINAQKLLFGNTNKGNLLNLFSGHFDTVVGPKTESSSYKKILDEIKSEPGDVLFFTDVPTEAKAAVSAGLQAVLVSRDGNGPLSDQDKADFTVIQSFSDIEFEQSTKKQKMSNDENCDVIVNKEAEHSSTYISEIVNGKGDDQIKPDISLDTDVEMVDVEEKEVNTGTSKEETKIIEETGSKESNVDMKMQPTPVLTEDGIKNLVSVDENTAVSSKNEIDKTNTKIPDEVKNDVHTERMKDDDIKGKKGDNVEGNKNDVDGKKDDDIEGKKYDAEDKKEHDVDGKKYEDKKACDGDVKEDDDVEDKKEHDVDGKKYEDKKACDGDVKEDDDVEDKKEHDGKKDNVEGKKCDIVDKKQFDVEENKEHDIEGKKKHDSSVVAQKNEGLADDAVGKENCVIDSSEDIVKPVKELNDNTVEPIKELSDNQYAILTNNEKEEVEYGESNENEIKSVGKNDKNEMELSKKSEIEEKAAIKTYEERNEISPMDKDSVETAQTIKSEISTAEIMNPNENNKSDLCSVDTNEVENKTREPDTAKETGHERTQAVTVVEGGNDKKSNVECEEPKKLEKLVSCSASTITAVETTENTVPDTTAVKIIKNAVFDTITDEKVVASITAEMKENVISSTTTGEEKKTVTPSNTLKTAENMTTVTIAAVAEVTGTVQMMDVTESKDDAECESDVLNPEENKLLIDEGMTQNKLECEQKMIIDEPTSETDGTSVCSINNLPEKEMIEKENDESKKAELQEKIIENNVCSNMEIENCDLVSDICEKDNTLNEECEANRTANDSVVELEKEENNPLKNDEVCSGVDNINVEENNEESKETKNSETEVVCVNILNETKFECTDTSVEKTVDTSHEKESSTDVKEEKDTSVTSVTVNGKHARNDSTDTEKIEGNGDDISKDKVEVTANGDTHENIKTDDEKTDTINEETESSTVVNGGTENVTDSVPEMKKVVGDAANNSQSEAISQPV